LILQLNFCVRF